MTKPFLIALFLSATLFQHVCAQQYADSLYNAKENLRVTRYVKYNDKEKLCEFYDNDTVRLKISGTLAQLNNWTADTYFREKHYLNGKLKSKTYFFIITSWYGTWRSPIKRHVHYRRNGKIKAIYRFSNYGVPLYDSLFNKNGTVRKVNLYKHKS